MIIKLLFGEKQPSGLRVGIGLLLSIQQVVGLIMARWRHGGRSLGAEVGIMFYLMAVGNGMQVVNWEHEFFSNGGASGWLPKNMW